MELTIDWKPIRGRPLDGQADLSPDLSREMAPLIKARDSRGMEALIQRLLGPIPSTVSLTFTETRTGSVAHRQQDGHWVFVLTHPEEG